MHPNPVYRQVDHDRNLAFARAQGFGTLVVSVPDAAPLISHIPFLLDAARQVAELHLVRSNPIARAVGAGAPATLAVVGPHGYVSPDWYGVEDQVPTWNYIAVHLTGRIERLPDAALPDVLDRLSDHFETRLAPKRVWTSDKMSDGVMDRMMRQIVPFRLHVANVSGTWKLNQNKPDAVRLSAADHMGRDGFGGEAQALADWMRDPPA